jgi:Superinfection immunity protein
MSDLDGHRDDLDGHKNESGKQLEGPMNELKGKWGQLTPPVRIGVIGAVVVIGLIVVLKILPALVEGLGIGVFLVILFIPYWIPTIIGFVRKHPSRGGILALNFFFGWTFVGWVVSLAWALSDNSARAGQQTVIVNTTVAGAPTTAVGTPPQTGT